MPSQLIDRILNVLHYSANPAGNGNGNGNGNGKPKDDSSRNPDYIEIPIPLPGGKRAYLKIPEDYKPEDCERIAKFVDALK